MHQTGPVKETYLETKFFQVIKPENQHADGGSIGDSKPRVVEGPFKILGADGKDEDGIFDMLR